MFDGDGAETLELQAYTVAKNATLKYTDGQGNVLRSGSSPCPGCHIIMDPVQALNSYRGLCFDCAESRRNVRVKGKMA